MTCAAKNFTGAPVAQNECAAAGFAYRKYSLAQMRATGALSMAQHQQSEFSLHGKSNGNRGNAAPQQFEGVSMDRLDQFVPFVCMDGAPVWVNVAHVRAVYHRGDNATGLDLGGESVEVVSGGIVTVLKVLGVNHG